MRKEVRSAVFSFLECGIPENGVARVRCQGCGHDFFVAFSCRARVVCPSCTNRLSLLFGEKVQEIVHPLNHRHLTFTIPKLLRAYLRRNRRLGKLLLRSTWLAWQEYLRKRLRIRAGMSGGIIAFITDLREVTKILEHIGELTSGAPPLAHTNPVPSSCDFNDMIFQYALMQPEN